MFDLKALPKRSRSRASQPYVPKRSLGTSERWGTRLTSYFTWSLTATLALAASALQADDSAVDFARDVQPILQTRCYECHGTDTREAGLRLDRKVPALAGGDAGRVITPGDADAEPAHAAGDERRSG